MPTVPARVAADARAADEALAALAASANTPPAPVPATPPATDPPANVVPIQPAPPAPPAPPASPPPTPAPTAQPTSVEEQLRSMHDRFASLSGRFEASERERLLLEGRLQQLQAAPPTPAPAPTPPPSLVTPQDEKDFGTDMIDFVERVVKQLTGGLFNNLDRRLGAIEGKVTATTRQVETVARTTQQTAVDRYLARLDKEIPGWKAQNDHKPFIDWLERVDILTARPLGETLQAAHQVADAEKVIHIFRLYRQETGYEPPASSAAQPNPPTQLTPQIDPASLAAPPSVPPAAPPVQPVQGRVWTQSDMDQLYSGKQKGTISDADFAKYEAELFRAIAEGRFQP